MAITAQGNIAGRLIDRGGAFFNVLHPDFGARVNAEGGIANATEVFQRAINAATPQGRPHGVGGAMIWVPDGQYQFTGPVQLIAINGLNIVGASRYGASLVWAGRSRFGGTADELQPMFVNRSSRHVVFENMFISSSSHRPLDVGFQMVNAGETGFGPTGNIWRNVEMDGTDANGLFVGWQWAGPETDGLSRQLRGSVKDANNDFNRLYDCSAANVTRWGFSIEHSQSLTHWFYNCGFGGARDGSGRRIGEYGVRCEHGSFRWVGGGGGHMAKADFFVGNPTEGIAITNFAGEDSRRLLLTGDSNHPLPVTIQNCRWDSNGLRVEGQSEESADGNAMIEYRYAGPLRVVGNGFTGGALRFRPRILVGQHTRSVTVTDNVFGVNDSANLYPIALERGTTARSKLRADISNNVFLDAGGTPADLARTEAEHIGALSVALMPKTWKNEESSGNHGSHAPG